MADSKSAYELERDKNIKANNAMLRSLGLLNEKEKCEPTVSKAPTVVKRKKEEDVVVLPSRKSARLNNVATVHQEVYSSSDDDDDKASFRKRKKKAKNAPSKDSAPIRQSKRRSEKMLPEVTYDFDEESDDDLDNMVFNVTDGPVADATHSDSFGSFDFDPYGFNTTSANDGICLPMPNDGATMPDETVDDPYSRPMFIPTMFFMDSETLLCPQA